MIICSLCERFWKFWTIFSWNFNSLRILRDPNKLKFRNSKYIIKNSFMIQKYFKFKLNNKFMKSYASNLIFVLNSTLIKEPTHSTTLWRFEICQDKCLELGSHCDLKYENVSCIKNFCYSNRNWVAYNRNWVALLNLTQRRNISSSSTTTTTKINVNSP